MLRAELAFYIGCLNLRESLVGVDEPVCVPVPLPEDKLGLTARGLYDPALSLRLAGRAVGNDVEADGQRLVMITGANQGGKSTFLRSVGVAQLMMQREEDTTMEKGKLDEELSRMRDIAGETSPGCLLLGNESFASTNEQEGSEIARQIIRALLDSGIRVFFVTHLFDLAHSLYTGKGDSALFLRPERREDGQRTFRLLPGEPLSTSYGPDLYWRIFGTPEPAVSSPQAASGIRR
jgi:DNA mismatch repair ATPase MutS